MTTELREVYLNGVDGHWASDDLDVQLELEIIDAICDVVGSSASQEIDVQLEIVKDDQVSVSYCSPGEMNVQLQVDGKVDVSVCEVKDLQLEMNRNDSVPELKSLGLVFEDLNDPAEPSVIVANDQADENNPTDPTAPQPKPGTDLFDTLKLCLTEPGTDLFDTLKLCLTEPGKGLVDTEKSCVPDQTIPELKPEVDLIDLEASCVPDPTAPEPKPGTDLFDTLKLCLTEPGTDLVDTEKSCVPDQTIPELKPEVDLIDPKASCVPDPAAAEPKPGTDLFDTLKLRLTEPGKGLVDTEKSCVPDQTIPELKPEVDLIDPEASCVPDPTAPQPKPGTDLVDTECVPDPSVPEPEPEVASKLSRLENYVPVKILQLEDRCKGSTLTNTAVTEVWPGVFIGNEEIARDRNELKKMGITHVLNAAAPKKNLKFLLGMASKKELLGTVNTGSRYYRGMHITYCGLPTTYRLCFDISEYFLPAAKFICKALRNPTSKVLIHCMKGLSHSVTLFLAYLMICHDMMVEDAIDHVMKGLFI
ncbi:hypothetical protein Q8A67_016924 [Cirrhinus molitorella]|uniref:Protein-serine/threonine phosphatase n=1 Tax=Cirrhinus molitorella TaxID=172907 RepID=A0AA88PSM9_9TELE|nr:hypothetical protein Q8A67_016924 [Cirrhinus molitorella]